MNIRKQCPVKWPVLQGLKPSSLLDAAAWLKPGSDTKPIMPNRRASLALSGETACPAKPAKAPSRMPRIVPAAACTAAAVILLCLTVFPADKLTGGDGLLYVGGRPNKISIIDEATEKVVGEITCKTGTPVDLDLSQDRKRFYLENIAFEDIEILDIASRQSIDSFRLSEGNKKMRIFGFEADPLNRYMILVVKSATKLADRFEIGSPTLYQYDLKEHKVMRTIAWPNGEEREFAELRFSPDGKFLYFFGDDILVYDTTDFKQVDKWEISRPIEDGFGRIDLSFPSDVNEAPGFYTGIFNVTDAVQNRRIMGIARVNLGKKDVDFFPLAPAASVGSFALAPGRKMGYGLHSEIGKYEFWSFDLEHRKLGQHAEFQGRPRMALRTSSNGKVLYIFQAGNTIDLYDVATFQYLRTISLDADMTTTLYVMPGL